MLIEKSNTSDLSLDDLKATLLEDFHDPDIREVYSDEFLNAKIATQIKVLREQRDWTQQELAERAEMKQERIAVLENVNHESWTLNVLRRLAKAFDLRIDLEFREFGSFFDDYSNMTREGLERTAFKDDKVFQAAEVLKRRGRFKVVPGRDKKPDDPQQRLFRPKLAVRNDSWVIDEYEADTKQQLQKSANGR